MKFKKYQLLFFMPAFFFTCHPPAGSDQKNKTIDVAFEKFTLDNGLQVIFHIDRSDPVVAVALTSHVGSAREIEGRTGFAHLFEHLLFLESENLGKGGLDKLSARVGGSGANGSTSRDRTNYYQTVPKDALEKMLWAEADKLGYFINTVTEEVLAKEKQVVKNEKRQGVDNQPYGHTSYVIDRNLYPEGHPYSWQVIGSLEDLQNATLQDVKDFYNRWYVPNNVTLSVAGDFDPGQAKAWVEKYFGEIKRGEDIPPVKKEPVSLTETKKLYHEDNFARLPELTLTWPGVPIYHADAYALDVLTNYLSSGKKAPLYKILVEQKQLTSRIQMNSQESELAGQVSLSVRAFDHVMLDSVYAAIQETFAAFEENGVSDDDLTRIKARQEVNFYNGLASVLGKGFQLAQFNIFAGDPGYINEDIRNILAVTKEDVMRVYGKYIKGKPFVATSFVPRGKLNLALSGSAKADVVEENIVQGAEQQFDLSKSSAYEKTPSSFDRSAEPPYGESPEINVPAVWEDKLANGIRVVGIENDEVPLVQFSLRVKGGLYLDDPSKVGVANLLAELLTRGTKNRTSEELEEAIQMLGATITVRASDEYITVSGSTLARNYPAVVDLAGEMLLQPRWDEKELMLAKQRIVSQIKEQQANPGSIADLAFRKLLYGQDHVLSNAITGTESSVQSITMDDLKAYYTNKLSPSLAAFQVVGAIGKEGVLKSLDGIERGWQARPVEWPVYEITPPPATSKVYFFDVPDAKQSVIRFGYPALAATDPDYYPAQVMNYILGGGGFASQLMQQLREGKGYTYGIDSDFIGSTIPGPFVVGSSVRSNVTLESAELVKEILENYASGYTEQDLEVTKGFLTKSNARAFETMGSKLSMLRDITDYGWPYDFVKQREQIVKTMTVEKIRALANKYIRPDKMYYLVVGDAKTQRERMKALGFGSPVALDNPMTGTLPSR